MARGLESGSVGLLSGRFVPGSLVVDAPDQARTSGLPAPRGIVEKRITDIDETEATLALDAVRTVLQDEGVAPGELGGLFVSCDDADETAGLLAKALGQERLPTLTFSPSRQAAAGALVQAVASAKQAGRAVLYVAARDTTRRRHNEDAEAPVDAGAGAVALLLGPRAPVVLTAQTVRHHGTNGVSGPDLLDELAGEEKEGPARVGVAVSSPGEAKRLLRGAAHGEGMSYPVDRLGDLGAASPGATLLEVLGDSQPGDAVDVLVPGAERTLGLRFRVQETPRVVGPGRVLAAGGVRVDGATARATQRAWADHALSEPRGAYVPLPVFHAQDAARLRFEGQTCLGCDKRLFPPRRRCPDCGGARFRPHANSGQGTVYSITRIRSGGAPAEFSPLQEARGAYAVAVVQLEEGPRVAAMLTGPTMSGEGVKIGDPVELVVRLLYVQDGVPRYSFKARRSGPTQ